MSHHIVKLNTTPSELNVREDAWVIEWPRAGAKGGNHHHTYGQLTPYFKALNEGKLLGTRCTNKKCPTSDAEEKIWVPPRADCPDCHARMEWVEVEKPEGTIYTYTYVERGGYGLEIECPYYQIDVRLPGVCTIVKGYLLNRDKKIKIGDKVRARFRTGKEATHTCLDLSWELV
ncbi:MAG: Zn-ribbon domain-containing OB-fold protein [Deltaproteobacteria bacterium]|nr:Zn-ribbon domain-containing OB-fold protein [Deltaproteobacteria bacterium]